MIPSHLNSVDIYHPFKGSKRDVKIRKGLVDLIIPNAAGPQVLSRLINSLLENLTYTLKNSQGQDIGGLRIIVISQGEHGSHNLLNQLKLQYPDAIFPVFKEKNYPPPVPYNDGLEFSARMMNPLSEYIMFLDDDMIVRMPGLIELEKNHLESFGFVNVATEHCFFGDKATLGPNGEAKDFGMGSFFFKRSLFEKIGYLDEYFKFHCSDTDFNWRIQMKGLKIGLIPDSDKYMIHEHQRGTHNFFKGTHQPVIDNDWVLFRKKWYHDGHNPKGPDMNCEKCKEIAETQLPLGRTRYLIDD